MNPRTPPARMFRLAMLPAVIALAGTLAWAAAAPRSGDARTRAYFLYSLAQQARLERNYSDALKYLEEAARSDRSADLLTELAGFYFTLGRADAAVTSAREAIAINPSHAAARRVLARALSATAPASPDEADRRSEAESIYRSLVTEQPGDEEAVLALASILLDREEAAGAAEVLEAYRASARFSPEVEFRLAQIYRQMGRAADAEPLLREILRREPGHSEAREALGGSLEETGRAGEAVDLFQDQVERFPENAYARYRLGRALLEAGRAAEAEGQLLLALRADPRNVRVLLALGRSYEATHRPERAEASYRKALEREPASLEVRFSLARLLQSLARDAEALNLYTQILDETGRLDSPETRAYHGMASAQIGILRFLQKDYQAAVLALEPVLRLADTPREDLYGLFARALVAAGRLDEAERVCGEGEKAHPQGVALPVLRAEILLRRGNHDEAKLLFRATVDRANGSEASYAETVEACVRVREFDEGERWASEGLERHPDSFHLRFQAGALQERLGKFREAERRFRELLRDDPDHAETLNYLGYMLADRGIKLEEAAGFLQRAVNLSPNNAAYQDSLGWAYYRLGRLEEAESLLRTAARGSRNDPTIYDHLGDVLSRRGKRDEALEAYRIAIEHEPDNPEEIRKKIRKISPRTSAP